MKGRISSIIAATYLLSFASAQSDELDEIFEEEVDPVLQDIWPRYFSTEFISIPEGATENNTPGGFWQEGVYSTVQNQVGD